MTDSDAAGLEARLKIVEDKLAIYELIASHPPSADTGSADYTSSVYLEDGVFDRGPTLDGATGVENIFHSQTGTRAGHSRWARSFCRLASDRSRWRPRCGDLLPHDHPSRS